MSKHPSAAERLDRAVDGILDGLSPRAAAAAAGADAATRRLVALAAGLQETLVQPPVGVRYEARLGARLASDPSRDPMAWARRHPGRLLVTGAVGSAVGVGVTAYAVWRSGRRPGGAHRLLHR
jgi:plasmid stabilization system protein ParE